MFDRTYNERLTIKLTTIFRGNAKGMILFANLYQLPP